jgi:dipeptidase D
MAASIEDLKPSALWKHFAAILTIPHGSGNEKALGDYILSVAKANGLAAQRDKVGNVVVAKKASPGHEQAVGVVLQGHLDMVPEKNSDVIHDFLKDPIKAEVKGEWVQAVGTTLGADNGIGLSAALAVLEDRSLIHGPLEGLFTVDEETGLTGAYKLGRNMLTGRKLLNLDSEDEGTFTIGCAGGADSIITFRLARKKTAARNVMRLKLSGFRGGHSGLDINQGRGNAIKLTARMLAEARDAGLRFELVGLEGGSKRNAIAREAWADVACEPAGGRALAAFFKKSFENIRTEYKAVETEAKFSFEKTEAGKMPAILAAPAGRLIDLLLGLPHGVIAMHPKIAGLTETSTNLAIIRTGRAQAEIICNTRSSIASALAATRQVLKAVCGLAGAKIVLQNGYPGWMPNLESALLRDLREVYKKTAGRDAEVVAVHAGLECGIIGEKYPGMDMISFGPTIRNPHSPEERVHIASVEKFWAFLVAALAALG